MQLSITESTQFRLTTLATYFATHSTDHRLGVFDSGVGGLEVVSAIVQELQSRSRASDTPVSWPLIFLGDTARFPFGEKTAAELMEITLSNGEWLVARQCSHVVIACNTASIIWEALISQSSLSVDQRSILTQHVWTTIAPTARAVAALHPHTVGVIATQFTVQSGEYERAILASAHTQPIVVQSAHQPLIDAIQRGDRQAMATETARLSQAFAEHHLDVLVLGCTHYGQVVDSVAQAVGKHVVLIDPARILGQVVASQLMTNNLAQISIHWSGAPATVPSVLAPLCEVV